MAEPTEATTETPTEQPQEHDVTCDECGASPIFGTRYKASHIFDFDICSECIKDHTADDRDKFVAFEAPIDLLVANDVCLVEDTGISACSLGEAADKIGSNGNNQVAKISLGIFTFDTEDDGARLQTALSNNTHLKIVHVHMCFGHHIPPGAVGNLAQGIALNTSIQRVFWHIGDNLRTEVTAASVRDMIAQNTTLEAVYLGRTCFDEAPSDFFDTETDKFATTIFESLKENVTLTTLRIDSYSVLSEKTKDVLLKICEMNETIRKMFLEFKYTDQRLGLLLACNREKWIQRLANVNATKMEQLEIIEEALNYDTLDPVSTAYHLLRSRPDLLG